MGTVFTMTPGAWGAVRFAPSWLWETMLAVRTLSVRHHQAVHQPWLAQVDRAAVRAGAPALVALIPRTAWTPDFLSPAAPPGVRSFGEQLAFVRRTPLPVVGAELRRAVASQARPAAVLRPLVDDPARARDVLTDQLQSAFDLLVRPWSGRLGAVLDAEVRRRGETAAVHGVVAAVDGVHESVRARTGAVRCAVTDDVTVRCRELVLVPSVFGWPHPVAVTGPAVAGAAVVPALAYPVPGVATAWEEPARAPRADARLLGRGRGDVLAALAEPATTTDLAARLGLAASTVSEHLGVLRDAGLVRSERHGRSVLYARTARGAAVGPAAAPRPPSRA